MPASFEPRCCKKLIHNDPVFFQPAAVGVRGGKTTNYSTRATPLSCGSSAPPKTECIVMFPRTSFITKKVAQSLCRRIISDAAWSFIQGDGWPDLWNVFAWMRCPPCPLCPDDNGRCGTIFGWRLLLLVTHGRQLFRRRFTHPGCWMISLKFRLDYTYSSIYYMIFCSVYRLYYSPESLSVRSKTPDALNLSQIKLSISNIRCSARVCFGATIIVISMGSIHICSKHLKQYLKNQL